MVRLSRFAFAWVTVLVLAACGGGSGGGVRSDPSDVSSTLTASRAQESASQSGLQAAQRAAGSFPRFGSVTQSANRDSVGVTTDSASTTFSAELGLVVSIDRRSGDTISLDTAQHTVDRYTGISSVTDREFAEAVVLKHNASEFTLGLVATDWSSDDQTDYLAGGYWLHATGDIPAGDITSTEMGAFVDGPELRGAPNLPVTGTATFSGLAAGLYAARYGTDALVPSGTHELGEFSGDLSLTADFSEGHISGEVDNLDVNYVGTTPDGEVYVGLDETDYWLNLGVTSLGSGGTFTGSDVTLNHPVLPITSSGSWGGRFSTFDDSAGNPRLVAGTLGGTGTTLGGSTVSFVGAFYGATPQFD